MIGPDGNGERPNKTVGAAFATEGVTLEVYTLPWSLLSSGQYVL